MGSRAQEEWLDLTRSTGSHRKKGRICGYKYSEVDVIEVCRNSLVA